MYKKTISILFLLIFASSVMAREAGYKFYSPIDNDQTAKDKVLIKAKLWNVDVVEINGEGVDIKNSRLYHVVPLEYGSNKIQIKMFTDSKITEKVFNIVRYLPSTPTKERVKATVIKKAKEPSVDEIIADALNKKNTETKKQTVTVETKKSEDKPYIKPQKNTKDKPEVVVNQTKEEKIKENKQNIVNNIKKMTTIKDNKYTDAFYRGAASAMLNENSTNWMIGGYLYGVTLGPGGVLLAYNNSAQPYKAPTKEYINKDLKYQNGYIDGYNSQAQKENRDSAVVGSLLGIITLAVLFI